MRNLSLTLAAFGLVVCAGAQEMLARHEAALDSPGRGDELYRLVKRFDFDERKLGNFEDVPMHWQRLAGEGLPAFSNGRFDDKAGRSAPPSFALRLQTGNVAYEYSHSDLIATSDSDYLVTGYIRAENVRHSRAFMAAYLVDQFGQRISGSERISQLIESTADESQPWQRVMLEVPGEFPSARALRLQFWILQASAWRTPDPAEVDPIQRQDIRATAWFDDVEVLRLPRARLRFSNSGGLVLPGRSESFIFDVANTTSQDLTAQLLIFDSAGNEVHRSSQTLPRGTETAALRRGPAPGAERIEQRAARAAVPKLPEGLYEADLRVFAASELLFERRLRFAVLASLPDTPEPAVDLGVDIGAWRGGASDGLVGLLSELGVGACKIGVEMEPSAGEPNGNARLLSIGQVVHEAAKRRIETIGVIAPPGLGAGVQYRTALDLVQQERDWRCFMSPAFAHFGGMLPSWQLDAEADGATNSTLWQPANVAAVREHLRRFVTSPEIIVPTPIHADSEPGAFKRSIRIPESVPSRDLVRAFAHFRQIGAENTWISLQTGAETSSAGAEPRRLYELTRRFVMAKACGAGRVFFDAPFRRSAEPGGSWEPTPEFPVLRTLSRVLGGKELVAVMRPNADVIACFFRGGGRACMVLWSWRADAATSTLDLYLGDAPHVIDIWGQPIPVSVDRRRTRLEVGEAPLIVDGMDSPQALFQASFRISPTSVQQHAPEPLPVVRFRNPYSERIAGRMSITPPQDWELNPASVSFELEPGAELEHDLAFTLPPRQPASVHDLKVHISVLSPERAEFDFTERLSVGLEDIDVINIPRWQGTALHVEQTLVNRSTKPVRFESFCVAKNRQRADGLFIDVPPGGRLSQIYVFTDASDLAGSLLHMGIQEIRGDRRLNQLVEVPRP